MTMEIGEFIAARLDAEERAARAAGETFPRWSCSESFGGAWPRVQVLGHGPFIGTIIPETTTVVGVHVVLQDPAATLARVAALRALVELHGRDPAEPGLCAQRCAVQTGPDGWMLRAYPCPTLRHVAAIRRDHEDYDERWKP